MWIVLAPKRFLGFHCELTDKEQIENNNNDKKEETSFRSRLHSMI